MTAVKGEYRRHERTGLKLPVAIQFAGNLIESRTLNISLSGLALSKTPNCTLKKNQVVNVQFSGLPGLSAQARVVHEGRHHVGLSLYYSRLSDADIESLIYTAPQLQRLQVLIRRSVWTQTRRLLVLSLNTFLRTAIIRMVNPQFLFAAYGTRRDADTYFTPWMEKLLPPVIICGYIRNGNKRGFLVASHYTETDLSNNPHHVRDYLEKLQQHFSRIKRIALVGRLPNFVLKAGLSIDPPLVSGAMGTRFMIWDVARQMRALDQYKQEQGIIVLGGAGRIGNQVCEDLSQIYNTVIAFDTRYQIEEHIPTGTGTLIRTSLPQRLVEHKLFIGLTHHGDVIREWADALPRGALIADDTHPCISLPVREHLAEHQIKTLKIVLGHADFAITPRMPAWNNSDIPGCLVEALVLLEQQDEVAQDFHRFCLAARNAGFQGRLIEPLDE